MIAISPQEIHKFDEMTTPLLWSAVAICASQGNFQEYQRSFTGNSAVTIMNLVPVQCQDIVCSVAILLHTITLLEYFTISP